MTANNNENNIIDLQRLQEISGGDSEFEKEILESYLVDAQEQIAAVKDAIEKADFTKIKHHAHQLKGASGNVGALEIQKLGLELEKLSAIQDTINLIESLKKLEPKMEELTIFINQL